MLDLFAGVGGATLAADSLGIQTTQFVEINPLAQLILRSHYPHIPIHSDIQDYWPKQHEFDIFWISFPCTGTSIAGTRTGLKHSASALWREALRCVCIGQPRIVIVEQPEGFIRRGLRTVLGALQMAGYTSEVEIISAAELGAMHRRLRVFIVSYSNELFPPNYSLPTRWSDTVRSMVEKTRNSAQWLSVKRTSDRIIPCLPPELVRLPIAVPNRYPGRLLSRQLAGNVVCPPQALVALKRAVYLLEISET